MDPVETVKTCLDEVLKKQDVETRDVAVAMQTFVRHCYIGHLETTNENAERLKRMESMLTPIAARMQAAVDLEKQRVEDRHSLQMHIMKWGLPMILAWILYTVAGGVKEWFKS